MMAPVFALRPCGFFQGLEHPRHGFPILGKFPPVHRDVFPGLGKSHANFSKAWKT
jgi:hypothetical protein